MTHTADRTLFLENPLGNTTSVTEIKDDFEFLDDWEERYGYVIDLGKQTPKLPEQYQTEENIVHGCQSQVWFVYHYDNNNNRLYILVDSDAMIVRGLAAVVIAAFNGKSPQEISAFDMEALFEELDLLKHLSPTRGNGLRAMVKTIQTVARHLQKSH